MYSVLGIITVQTVGQAVVLIPLMVPGLVLGMFSSNVLDEKRVRRTVIVMLIVSGALVINSVVYMNILNVKSYVIQ